jgi:undecaprenyl diphosphate synthase
MASEPTSSSDDAPQGGATASVTPANDSSDDPSSASPEGNSERSPADVRAQQALRQRGEIPPHIACIMDGNGRWAQGRDQHRSAGHYEGVSSVRDVAESCAQVGVDYLTLYTFSTENWNRPVFEVNALMELLIRTIEKERETLMKNNIRLATIGDLEQLPDACRQALDETRALTSDNTEMTLTLALSYSGRWEILQAVRHIAKGVERGDIDPDAIDESLFASFLDTAGIPDPDLIIRTGGEYRLSNFLLWQSAYTELYITDCFWPDFRSEELYDALRTYQDRDRRFGGLGESDDAPSRDLATGDGLLADDAQVDPPAPSPEVTHRMR